MQRTLLKNVMEKRFQEQRLTWNGQKEVEDMKELQEEIREVIEVIEVEEEIVMISVSFAEKGVTLPEIAETKGLEVLEVTDLHAEVDEAGVAAEVLEGDQGVEVEAPERESQATVQDDTKVDQKVGVLTKRRQGKVIAEVRALMQRPMIRNEVRATASLDPGLDQRMERRKTTEKTVLKEEKDPQVLSLSNLEISHPRKIRPLNSVEH